MAMPSKAKIFEHWMDWLDKKGLDWGEPSCWACGRHWEDEYDIKDPKVSREKIISNWNRVPLQRCHIIAKQLGGSDDVSNLFLMCKQCHDKAPNTLSRESFFQWVEQQDHSRDLFETYLKEIKNFGLDDKIDELTLLIKSPEIMKEIYKKIGIHMNQTGYGPEITVSSIMAALAEYLKNKDGS